MKRSNATRIVAIVLALLMALGAASVLFVVLGANVGAAQLTETQIPSTGVREDWVFYVIGAAVVVAALCMILPRVIKPKQKDDDDEF